MNVDKLRTLWDSHAKAIHACLLQVTRSPQDASDLLQDIFCRLARQPELLAGLPDDPRGFLLRLARNLAIDHLRRAQARDRIYEKVQAASEDAVGVEDPDNPLLRQALAEALQRLPQEQREVVHDRLWKKRTLDEIAAARGISINTAASRYRYGLDKMREVLRPLYADLSNQPLSTPDNAMKNNPQDPIIRPLDPRRVPSATGLFSLPVIPAPEEVEIAPEDLEMSDEAEVEPEVIDVPVEGEDAELPVTFDEVIEGIDEEAEGDLDVVWAYQEIFMVGGPVIMIEDGEEEVIDEEGSEEGDEGDGDEEEVVDEEGEVADGTGKGDPIQIITIRPIYTLNGNVSGADGGVVTSFGGEVLRGNTGTATEPDVLATEGPAVTDTAEDVGPIAESQTTSTPTVESQSLQQPETTRIEAVLPVFDDLRELDQPGALATTHDHSPLISLTVSQSEATPVSAAGTVLPIEGDRDSVADAGIGESAVSFAAEDATVEQWVPLPVLAADHPASDVSESVILTDPALQPIAAREASADPLAQLGVREGVLAMAVTGAMLASHDPKPSTKRPLRNILAIFIAFLSLLASGVAQEAEQPLISKIRGRSVTVTVPAGFDSVSLQKVRIIRRAKGRAERVWATVDTKFPVGEAKTLTFRLGSLTPRRLLRVISSRTAPLPENFTTGVTSFGGDTLSLNVATNGGPQLRSGDVLSGGITTTSVSTANSTDGTPATVVESDIWKIHNDRIYFYNQLRGLQVIDVTNPDTPGLLGTLRMPASGEDLYVVGENHVALLKRSNNWWWGGPIALDTGVVRLAVAGTSFAPNSDTERTNELVIADVSAGAPRQVASVPFKGSLHESRLVGNILYVATSTSRTTDVAGTEYGTEVIAFDLSDPANPVERDSVFIPGWAAMVTATPDYFVVTNGWPNTLQLVDISAGDGTLSLAGAVAPEGYVADKFKIDIQGDVLTVLSQVWLPWEWDENGELINRGGVSTSLQTFSLADPSAPAPLGRIVIAPGESLRATRFDDGRVYVVTFEQIDPLHIVDLSDPTNPTVSGEVEAPGFSTYIEPLGDRLVTIGLVDWQPAVSLFDVSDPAAPALLQQLKLGGKNDGWSHSEAVWNEKAFKVIAQHNLVLLPISGYDRTEPDQWGGEWFARVQLIDLKRDSLAARGVIDANFSPRRADIVKANRIAAISPSKLVVVNAGNRDEPKLTAELQLAWSVDRVFHIGDHLVQIGGSADWTGSPAPTLSVSPASEPDDTLTLVDLDPLEVVGATLNNGTLYLAQRAWPRWWISDAAEDRPQLLVSAYDVSALPALRKLSQASGLAPVDSWGNLTPLWPSPGTLVWAADGRYYSNEPVIYANATARLDVESTIARPWFGTWTKQFVSFNVGTPEKIAYGTTVELKPAKASQLSEPFAQAGLVFVSEQQLWDYNTADDVSDAGKHYLRVIEYTEPAAPHLRDERVNIPGRLAGVAREGKLLYTVGADLDTTTGAAKDTAALHASAFNGAAAHLIATHPLANVASSIDFAGPSVVILDPQPAYVWKPIKIDPIITDPIVGDPVVGIANTTGATLTIARPSIWWGGSYEENPLHSSLHIAQLTDAGAFTELGSLELAHDSGLHLFGDLAVTQPDSRSVRAIDISNTLAPADLGAFSLPGNVWPNLDGADGALGVGLWIPAGGYGIETISLAE